MSYEDDEGVPVTRKRVEFLKLHIRELLVQVKTQIATIDLKQRTIDELRLAFNESVNSLNSELAEALERIKSLEEEVIEHLQSIISQAGNKEENGEYDSMALSAVADAMERLEELGRFEITKFRGHRRCFGRFKAAAPGEGDGGGK